jgi:hypothetical protein
MSCRFTRSAESGPIDDVEQIEEGFMGTVYLLHFSRPYKHARHYLGYVTKQTKAALAERLERHKNGSGARLMEVVTKEGITFEVAKTWKGNRALERQLKKRRGAVKFFAICRAQAN